MSDRDIIRFLLLGAGAFAAFLVWMAMRHRRRAAEVAQPFPPEWRTLLKQALPLYSRMPQTLRQQLEPLVRAFLAEVRFVGCDGLEITDEMRLLIATQACLLIAENNPKAYRDLMSVLVYPDRFVIERQDEDEAGVVTQFEDEVSGEAQDTTRIVLSWRDIREPSVEEEVCNVVLHEFAHYLDASVGGDFTDLEGRHDSLAQWHDLLEEEFNAHCDAVDRDEETLISPAGADDPAEFFAYATEVFFEIPGRMRQRHPQLYEGLKQAYGLDPAEWRTG